MKCVVLLCIACLAASPLTADQIALVVNRNEPVGAELAQFYAQARGIPQDRIISLDLPLTIEMTFDRYERNVTPVVREFLRTRGLEGKIRCLVTFYGVPLRIADRVNGMADNHEITQLNDLDRRLTLRLIDWTRELEARAKAEDSSFNTASTEQTFEALVMRVATAAKSLNARVANTTDPTAHRKLETYVNDMGAKLSGPVDLDIPKAGGAATTTAALANPQDRPFDPEARAAMREQARRSGGIFNYSQLVKEQIGYFTTEATGAAVDNELALVLAPVYSRAQWRPNPLNVRNRATRQPPMMMVMRLDAPNPQLVKDIIANSIAAEREGLHGKMVVDARGLAAGDPMGMFDQQLRNLSEVTQKYTTLPVFLDNNKDVIPPHTVDDVALYCGWYSLANYVPGMKFNRGAVGYHVASFELLTLHGDNERGWVAGLLRDGVVATLGPVAEPYLHSFPSPVEFFTLLETGKLNLAEVYWATNPCVSWMQAFIGDPLYNPFAKSPQIKPQDLPETYQVLFE